ncbi:glycosyltransferase family 2 protein [Aeromonas veronii]|uniref:glycosyltransferase family 2 protein n=1 Tax=Aeromonas veronii TaxID=654 RepID=UPI003D1BE39E
MSKLISYCIPVMGRLNDIKSTLKHNLKVAEKFSESVEVIVNCFDFDDQTEVFIKSNFNECLQSGLLKFNRLSPMPYWHFCWAKNSFKRYLSGTYYASLDGDNFITESELKATIELCKSDSEKYLIHLFSGQWGDGTSGRIIIPSDLYIKHGYLNTMLPRQFDEMALMLSILKREDVTFVSRPNVNIFSLSGYAKNFCKLELCDGINHTERDFGETLAPLMPRGEGYAEKDPKLSIFQGINAFYSMHEISTDIKSKDYFQGELKKQQVKIFEQLDITKIYKELFKNVSGEPAKSSKLTVYSVIKNDSCFLKDWYEHYKKLGVERFIIIDDYSDVCTSETLNYNDVYVFKPRVGNFKLFKTFWIKCLCEIFQEKESWLLTIDSDEFLDPSAESVNGIGDIIARLEVNNKRFCGGILIDMMTSDKDDVTQDNYLDKMDYHFFRKGTETYSYDKHPSIKWAFSTRWELSYRLDFRFRYYGTIDSLRKFPLVKYSSDIQLNQGFHGLSFGSNQFSADDFFSESGIVIPIKHYKFFKVTSRDEKEKLKHADISGYFGRTRENISRIVKSEYRATIGLFMNSIHKKRYSAKDIMNEIGKYKGQ